MCVQGHDIDWDGAKVIDQAGERMERRVKEAVHIASRSQQKLMNKGWGMKISEQWKGLMRHELQRFDSVVQVF